MRGESLRVADGVGLGGPLTAVAHTVKEPGARWRNTMWDAPAFTDPPPDPDLAPEGRSVTPSTTAVPGGQASTPAPTPPKATRARTGPAAAKPARPARVGPPHCRVADVDRVPPGVSGGRRPDLIPTVLSAAYTAGASISGLARTHDSTHATIRRILLAAGVTIDSSGGRPRRLPGRLPGSAHLPAPGERPEPRHAYADPIGPKPPTPDQAAAAVRFAARKAELAQRGVDRNVARNLARIAEAVAARARAAVQTDPPPAPARTPRPAAVDNEARAWIRRYQNGESVNRIAASCHRGPATVRRVVTAAAARGEVTIRDDRATYSGRSNATRLQDPDFITACVTRYLSPDKPSAKTIAHELGTGPRQVMNALNLRRVTIRPALAGQPADHATELRRIMADLDITAHAVREWCAATGRSFSPVGNPNGLTVLAYVAATRSPSLHEKESP